MSENPIAIVEAHETIFFSHHEHRLCQWIMLTVDSGLDRPAPGSVTLSAEGSEERTQLEVVPGVREYRVYGPALWPHRTPVDAAPLTLAVGDEMARATCGIGHHRPWKIYLLSDVCTDTTWVYGDEETCRADDADTMDAEMSLAEATRNGPPANRNHYNMVVAREVEFYLDRYPQRASRLIEHIRAGNITLNPFHNMALTGDMSLEEMVRQFYPARNFARQHGLEIGYANHQETPSIAWAMATVLAGSGIRHLVKSILFFECVWVKRLEEPRVFAWEGPDGSRVLVHRRNEDYVEGNFVLKDLRATTTALHSRILPMYEGLGERCPYDAVALVGCYGDLDARSRERVAQKTATISAYNAQGWEYPKLINASHKQYWDDLDAQIADRHIQVPVYRGDYGTGWEVWPASMASSFAGWRRAQERAGTADKLASIVSRLDPGWYAVRRSELARGWTNLTRLGDHAWNGANDRNLILNSRLRHDWQTAANEAFDRVVADGLAALAERVPAGNGRRILVFNGLGWQRSGVALAQDAGPGTQVVDVTTGEVVPSEVTQDGLYFAANDVPAVGYRVFRLEDARAETRPIFTPWQIAPNRLEGPYYSVEVSPLTGGIVSLYDKVRGRDLIDKASPYHLNQCLYLSDGVDHTPARAQVEPGACSLLRGQLVVHAQLKNISLTSTITLYSHLDRVDIRNDVHKVPSSEKQELNFVFPFDVPDRQYRFETPGAIVIAGEEQRPGSGQATSAVRHFVDVSNAEFGITLAQADAGLVEFGHRTSKEDPLAPPPDNGTVFSVAMENLVDWDESIRDQAGVQDFVFRYSLRGHAARFDAPAAVRFGWEDNNELLPVRPHGGQAASLPADRHSFLEVEPGGAVLATLKVAEEGGLIVRLWECAGEAARPTVHLDGLGMLSSACETNLLEEDGSALQVADNRVTLTVPARGLATARLLVG